MQTHLFGVCGKRLVSSFTSLLHYKLWSTRWIRHTQKKSQASCSISESLPFCSTTFHLSLPSWYLQKRVLVNHFPKKWGHQATIGTRSSCLAQSSVIRCKDGTRKGQTVMPCLCRAQEAFLCGLWAIVWRPLVYFNLQLPVVSEYEKLVWLGKETRCDIKPGLTNLWFV